MAESKLKSPIVITPKNKKIAVKMPADMKEDIPKHVLEDGYNMREKSRWVSDAVEQLLSKNDWEGVLLSQLIIKTDANDVFTIPAEVYTKINDEVRRLATEHPSLNANQSTIIRAAIQRRSMGI